MRRIARVTASAAVVAGAFGLTATLAFAQPAGSSNPSRRTGWQFEIHGGSTSAGALTTIFTSELPPAGQSFPDFRGGQSRFVPSWFFGDGALLANQVSQQTGDGVSIVPLDSVLTHASANRKRGGSFGVRIGHTVTSHVLAEFAYDTTSGHVGIDPAALTAIAATTASFRPYWTAVITRAATPNVQASAASTIADNVGTMKLFIGEGAINIVTVHGWTPYFEIGGGIAFPSQDEASATLVGHYQTNLDVAGNPNNGALFSETDTVRIRYQAQPAIVTVVGGGVEGDFMRHLGVRADVRAMLGADRMRTRIDTSPSRVVGTPGSQIARAANPSLQISSNFQPSSLSFQGVDHFPSFEAAGQLLMLSVGAFFRF
jgi:hypothetical protein